MNVQYAAFRDAIPGKAGSVVLILALLSCVFSPAAFPLNTPAMAADDVSGSRRSRINVESFGAKGDGQTDDRPAIQRAIDEVSKQGGGVVYLPAGRYKLATPTLHSFRTVDHISAPPNGALPSFSRGDVYLKISSGNVSLEGDGIDKTILESSAPGTVINVSGTTADPLPGISVTGLTLQYAGGWYGGTDGGTFGLYVLGDQATILRAKFRNFLNGLVIAPKSRDCVVENNTFVADHGRASCGYPRYPNPDSGPVYIAHPAVMIRNYGERSRIVNNFADCLVGGDFSQAGAAPEEYRQPMDGLLHGYGEGGIVSGNTVLHFSYEGIYLQQGEKPDETMASVSGNLIDGLSPMLAGNSSPAFPSRGRFGIRVDCDNACVTGNIIRNVSVHGITIGHEWPRDHKNVVINNNILTNVTEGIYISSPFSDGVISGNLIKALEPDDAARREHLNFKYGILLEPDSVRRVLIANNALYGSTTGWYYAVTRASHGTAIGDSVLHVADASGIQPGKAILCHGFSQKSQGQLYWVSKASNGGLVIKGKVYGTPVREGDPLFVYTGGDHMPNAGIVIGGDGVQIQNNVLYNFTQPIVQKGAHNALGNNTVIGGVTQ